MWRKICSWFLPKTVWIVFDHYHDRILFTWPNPVWFATRAEAEAVALEADGETGRKRFEAMSLKRAR